MGYGTPEQAESQNKRPSAYKKILKKAKVRTERYSKRKNIEETPIRKYKGWAE